MDRMVKNRLVVSSTNKEQLGDFINSVCDEEYNSVFSLHALLPCPDDFRQNSPDHPDFGKALTTEKRNKLLLLKYGTIDPWEWYICMWGTEMDVFDPKLVEYCAHFAVYEFESLYTPPKEWVHNVALRYPDIEFRLSYIEPGSPDTRVFVSQDKTSFYSTNLN